MDLETFERRAFEMWEAIPERFRVGVRAVVLEPGPCRDDWGQGWIYGHCRPDEVVMAAHDAPPTSIITLYYGSFVFIAEETADFDWEEELWETLRHELQHHLEFCADIDPLGEEDERQEQNSRRHQGLPFELDFHRGGVPLGHGAYLTDHDLFLEVPLRSRAWRALASEGLRHRWFDVVASAPPLAVELLDAEVLYVRADVEEIDADDALMPWSDVVLVLRRRRGWFW